MVAAKIMPKRQPFSTSRPWNHVRPHILVVACSDGRLQEATDELLNERFGIAHYDRLYLPGGPGALVQAGGQFTRSSRIKDEFLFLLKAHEIEEVVLMFHGPAEDGPDEAICADYKRVYSTYNAERIRKQQELDTEEILRGTLKAFPQEHVFVYRLEVTRSRGIDVKSIL
ncbi:MAG: hypothetical protein KF784_08105 [Fimbriimonadaceae bacterium]|nr:hypothetical protein [Fimbriimonadaceae bacterium]